MAQKTEWVITGVAARFILGLSVRTVEKMCQEGVFKSARKPGMGKTAEWRLSRSEVEAHLNRKIYEE